MMSVKEIGECLITVGENDYFFRPSFMSMARIGEPTEIVQVFYDLFNDEITPLLQRALEVYGRIPDWLFQHIKQTEYGRQAFMSAIIVLNACCENDATPLTGIFRPSKRGGRTFKIMRGLLPEADILFIAQHLITHGVIGKAKVRRLQKNESNEGATEFNAIDYIVAAMNHFGMSKADAQELTMTHFQLLLASKYPEQKGYTKEEYDSAADKFFERRKRRLAK